MYKKLVAGIVAYTFLLYSCITPNFVSLESPAPGAEFVVLNNEGIPLKTQRVLVAEVVPGSPAFESGICPEDPIIAINGEIPRTAAQAHAMLSDTTEVNLKIDSGGSEREVALVRKGIFGISFKNEFPIETTIKASGAETTLLVTHRDYLSFTDTISATKKIGGPKRQKFATAGQILLSFGLSFIAGSIILRPLAETTNYDNYPKTSTETDPGIIAISDFLMVLGPLGVIAGIPMLGYGHAKTYESKYTVPSRSLETHTIFDADGFNPKTGVDRYGITRNGVYPDGSRFDGKLVAGKREGYGSMISPDGKFAIMGTFKNDMLNGLAMEMRLTDPEHPLLAFFGYFLANKRSGVGIEFDENGKPATLLLSQGGIEQSRVPYPAHPVKDSADLLFLGPGFTNGKAEGRGLAILLNGKASQEGDFINGELKEGVKRSVDGSLQQGTFEKGFLVRGLIRNPDGSGGEGFWRNGSLQSPGRIIYANGNVYSGDFDAQGIPSGEGALVYANGDLYIGSFVHGIPEGRGTYSFKSGTLIYRRADKWNFSQGQGR
ncbi:hypothetical protein MASR2M78_01980 [Treponema sp.]